ncbi:MAG: type II toxin-antitoxin system VapC family toxin [Chloroflexi bacterium]|nr:type II toxin-antitoxin system VapC family toxin [Chloroflexota bacterium]
MSFFYLDSSALVKRYLPEAGTNWLDQIFDPVSGHILITSQLTLAETAAVLGARGRAPGGLSTRRRERLLSQLLEDTNRLFMLIPVQRQIIMQAVQLSQKYRLRGYDSVQLASALAARRVLIEQFSEPELILLASDQDLLDAGQREGIQSIDPAKQTFQKDT